MSIIFFRFSLLVPAFIRSFSASTVDNLSEDLKQDVKSVLEYMDKLLINLPEEKIKEFAASDHFEVYRKLFSELGLE